MEAIFLDCGAGGPQLKRNPLDSCTTFVFYSPRYCPVVCGWSGSPPGGWRNVGSTPTSQGLQTEASWVQIPAAHHPRFAAIRAPRSMQLSNKRLKLAACGRRLRRKAQWKLSILSAAPSRPQLKRNPLGGDPKQETPLMSLFGRAGSPRDEALAKGVAVDDVERDLPHFRGNRLQSLQRGTCVCYSLPRRPGSLPHRWAFLQRDAKPGAPFPNGWTFQSADSDVPQGLRDELNRIAGDWSEEFLEFEGNEEVVSAYWEEWGGAKEASVIIGYLQALAQV